MCLLKVTFCLHKISLCILIMRTRLRVTFTMLFMAASGDSRVRLSLTACNRISDKRGVTRSWDDGGCLEYCKSSKKSLPASSNPPVMDGKNGRVCMHLHITAPGIPTRASVFAAWARTGVKLRGLITLFSQQRPVMEISHLSFPRAILVSKEMKAGGSHCASLRGTALPTFFPPAREALRSH